MHIILTGATGLVGTSALNYIIQHSFPSGAVTRLSILSRSPVPLATKQNNPDIQVITYMDYISYPSSLLEQLKDADGCIWAQGVSQNQVSKEDYQKITFDYPIAAAKAFASLKPASETGGKKFVFVYVSGDGATQNPGILTPRFGKVKGEAETALIALQKDFPSLRVFSVRPGGVDPQKDPETKEAYTGYLKGKGHELLLSAFRTILPSRTTPTKPLGKFLTELALGSGEPLSGEGVEYEGRIVNNAKILNGL